MKSNRNEILTALLDALWKKYLKRVSYAKTYVGLVKEKGGKVVNDHIAFRTFNTNTGEQPSGIEAIRHIFLALGYQPAGHYTFRQKKLNAIHFQHPNPLFPKIFISQLEVAELPGWAQKLIDEQVENSPYLLTSQAEKEIRKLTVDGELEKSEAEHLLDELPGYFTRPWGIPKQRSIEKLNEVSQYAAWTLLHGNSVNHFTAFINFQEVKEWPDLQTTCEALAEAGVPMKETIEGQKGSKLQQSSTQAVSEMVEVTTVDGSIGKIPWTYAYYELAERGLVESNGKQIMFSGFLGEQATHLFDMTSKK
ncbi:DUF1338 domain-containing protein [Sunxiuqinia sp. A32]|uniref:DUF1338 domain-containing protein n=1 Tax=Sunxiuqinia sp. A32 TaxID=3461496 RepID=UPI0040466F8F